MAKKGMLYSVGGVDLTTGEMLQRFLSPAHRQGKRVLPPVVCADGFRFSAQASRGHYCTPQDDAGPWTHVEVYFAWAAWPRPKRLWNRRGADVDGYVPLDKVAALIDKHGGLAVELARPLGAA